MLARESTVILAITGRPVDLRNQLIGFALNALQRFSENGLSATECIAICSVKGCNAGIDR